MADQAYPSKRQRGKDQPSQKKLPQGQSRPTSTPSQTFDTVISQDHDTEPSPDGLWQGYRGETVMDWQHDGSEKPSSISSPVTSYLNAEAPSGGFFDQMGGYVMVSNRPYPSRSNQTSGEGSERSQQAYFSPSWTPGTEEMQDLQVPVHPHQLILPDLSTESPQTVHDPYQQGAASSSGSPEFEGNYSSRGTYHMSIADSFPPLPKAHHGSSPPWNQYDPRVLRYEPAFAAFALSPGPAGEPEAQELLMSPPRKSRLSQRKSSSRSSKSIVAPGKKQNSESPGWEHIVVDKGALKTVSECRLHVVHNGGGGGRRKGKLMKEAAEKAARVRKVKACWHCWLLKVSCSEEETCKRCLKYSSSSFVMNNPCSRSGFADYEDSFFPDYLHSHLNKADIKTLVNEHSDGFIGDAFEVKVSTGAAFKPMNLQTHFFKPKGWESELLRQHHLTVVAGGQNSKLLCRYSAPIGLMALSTCDMKKILRQHVEQMAHNSNYTAQTTAGDFTKVPLWILEAMTEYCNTTESSLVRNALKLHAIHYFMSSLITFTADSAEEVYVNSPNLNVPPEPYLSSRLLNRQLKFVMNRIHRETTRDLLENLEKAMRSRTKDAWGPCFATILVLCLCIEGLQTAADTFVVADIIKDGPASQLSRGQSWAACAAIEEYPYQQCTRLFHEIFRSSKVGNGGGREGGFNPLGALQSNAQTGLDAPTDLMVTKIYSMVCNDRDDLQALSERPVLHNYGFDVDLRDIKINNTGRLAAKFLLSFFAKDA